MEQSSIIENINSLLTKIFLSVETKIFSVLDDITYVSENILKNEPLKNMKLEDKETICLVISSFIIFLIIIFVVYKFLNMYDSSSNNNLYIYMFKLIICAILSSMSVYILSEILKLNSLFTDVIKNIGEDITGYNISFDSLKDIVKNMEDYMTEDFVSLDGVIKGLVSFGMITLTINLSIRYVTILFLIFISPVAFILAASANTFLIFKNWLILFITELLVQDLIYALLIIPLSFKSKEEYMFKIVLIGSIYLLYRVNNFSSKIFANVGNKVSRRD